jgi:diacylglycerol kinase family enzyme
MGALEGEHDRFWILDQPDRRCKREEVWYKVIPPDRGIRDLMTETGAERRTALIVNPLSAQGRWLRNSKLRDYIRSEFPAGVHDEARDKAEMIALARRLSLENDIIVVMGGDGTLADVQRGIADAGRLGDVILGIIPLGSGNGLRSSLAIPKMIRKAIRVIRTGIVKPIDLIEIDGHIANFISIGATAKATLWKTRSTIPGLIGHTLASRTMFTYHRKLQDIELFDGRDDDRGVFDHKTLRLKLYDCIINKANYFGYNWLIAPKAKLDDGYLDITLFDIRAYSYLVYYPLIYLGQYQKVLKHYKAKRMIIRGKELHIQFNGEPLPLRDEVEIKVLPKALRVICPTKVDPGKRMM